MLSRRHFLQSSTALACASGLNACAPEPEATTSQEVNLDIQSATFNLTGEGATQNMVSLSADAPPPVLRIGQGQEFTARITNRLSAYTSMHWHGLRLPNEMDGVPYLTQIPMGKDDAYTYRFTPPDAGTYWYHPHCMTMDQMARGLTGVLIVEEEEAPGFDEEIILNLRDFRLGQDNQFKEIYTARGAARAGTFGNVLTANWEQMPVYTAPSGSLVRLRIVASDTSRIYRLALPDSEGLVIAMDGHPLTTPLPWPTKQAPLILSPGQRVDIALKMPTEEGRELALVTMSGNRERPLAALRAAGTNIKHNIADLRPLRANPLSIPTLDKAEVHEFVFGWSPSGDLPNNGFCGTMGYTFWSINRKPWPGDASGTGPLATLKQGESHILRLRNESPNEHPIHLHGLTFMPIRSNKRDVIANWTDTALLLKGETLDIALVADNPGDWAFHCHVIEHQKTGLAGYIRVA
ncbi:MAG: multicopper oxidase family protein [Parvibaculum sp.]